MNTSKCPASNCPACNTVLDAATGIAAAGHKPEHGDVSFCIACGELLQFDADLRAVPFQGFSGLPEHVQEFLLSVQNEIRNMPRP